MGYSWFTAVTSTQKYSGQSIEVSLRPGFCAMQSNKARVRRLPHLDAANEHDKKRKPRFQWLAPTLASFSPVCGLSGYPTAPCVSGAGYARSRKPVQPGQKQERIS